MADQFIMWGFIIWFTPGIVCLVTMGMAAMGGMTQDCDSNMHWIWPLCAVFFLLVGLGLIIEHGYLGYKKRRSALTQEEGR